MRQHVYDYDGLLIHTSAEWSDITEDESGPFTLAKEDGVGALQFSMGFYQSGTIPNPTSLDLLNMALDYGKSRNLSEAFDIKNIECGLLIGAASFRWGTNFIRVWYISDSYSFVFMTYVCDWNDQGSEITESEVIARQLSFP